MILRPASLDDVPALAALGRCGNKTTIGTDQRAETLQRTFAHLVGEGDIVGKGDIAIAIHHADIADGSLSTTESELESDRCTAITNRECISVIDLVDERRGE